jgi:hypothetical protein
MGVNKREQQERQPQQRKRTADVHKGSTTADWAGCDPTTLMGAVAAVSRDNGAIRLGYTRDGGAYAIGIYGDGEPFTEYVRPGEDIDEYLRGLIRDYGKKD